MCYNFQIFVAMAMWVGLTQTSLAQLNSPTPMTPTRCRNRGHISHTYRVIANFMLKFSNCRCHGNEGWSGTNFTSTLNPPTPITTTMSRNGGRISHTSRVIANFVFKFSNFRHHGNRGWSGTNFTSTVKFADTDNPLLGPGMGVVSPIQAELLPILC